MMVLVFSLLFATFFESPVLANKNMGDVHRRSLHVFQGGVSVPADYVLEIGLLKIKN